MAYRLIVFAALALILLLQVRLWSGDDGLAELNQLEKKVNSLQQQVEQQKATNRTLEEKILAIRNDPRALEALARQELGMLKADERFIRLIVLPATQPSTPQSDTPVTSSPESQP
ncbi:cell division protein FtsB [Sulfurivirga caldicuralii]|uniref:Cell division protein FtsB n=1 Tax=Sulfurivirga caldicuralii TaxID=364032 RepID=A0A1N6F906_9GAMM|nr:septum formation initiator family protein [Sulfurivirga caldicuralii]SIN91696.1 cell division protein FtsB [Sulfurivirga caldicuralii]